MAIPNTDRERLWGQLAVSWQLLDAADLERLEQESAANPAIPIEQLLEGRHDISDDDRQAIAWMVERLSQTGHSTGLNAVLSTLAGDTSPSSSSDSGFESTLDQSAEELERSTTSANVRSSRFDRQHLHAKGGIGQVWVARDRTIDRSVALKELRPERAGSSDHRARFLFEAQVTGQLEHPGVVPVYELDANTQSPCYSMRFFRGRTLKEAIAEHHQRRTAGKADPLEFISLVNAFVSICNTIEYAHSRSVVHRDLKGQNVVLGDFGEVIVLDWGLAKRHNQPDAPIVGTEEPVSAESSNTTVVGAIVGTPAYMSPEQACGLSDRVGPASDVYSLGVILFELLTGRLPFEAQTRDKLLNQVIHETPPSPRSVTPAAPAPLGAICLKALGKQPEDRYASVRELADDVRRFLADEPVNAWHEPLAARCARWGRKHRTFVTTAAAVLIVAVVGLATGNGLLADANRRVTEEREIALANEKDAKANGERAERNFRRALSAVNDYLTNVSQSKLLNVPGLHALRRELLEDALAYYEAFAEEDADNPQLRAELADAQYRIARIHAQLGQVDEARTALTTALTVREAVGEEDPVPPLRRAHYLAEFGKVEEVSGNLPEALAYYEQAIKMLDECVRVDPQHFVARADLAANQLAVGQLQYRTRNLEEARGATEAAVEMYQRMVDDAPEDLKLTVSLGQALTFRGVLERDAGDPSAALTSFADVISRLEPFRTEQSEDMELRDVLSMCYHSQGILLRDLGRFEKAQASFESAIEVRKSLTRDYPTIPETWIELATTYNSLGILHWRVEELDDALRYYDLAVEQQQRLVDFYPKIPLYRSDLASNHNNVAIVHRQRGDFDKAIAAYNKGIHLREQLLKDSPEFVPNQVALGSTYRNVGRVYDAQADFQQMLDWCDRAVSVLEPLRDRIGDDPRVLFHLRRVHWDRAEALLELNRPADSANAWGEAWQFDDGRERDYIAMQRARARALAGDHRQATDEAEQLSRTEIDGETSYDGACVFSLSVAALATDTDLTDEQRESLAARYGSRAVEMLRLSGERGYLDTPEARQGVSTDEDLIAIRDRADFRQLVAQLQP